MNKRRKFLNRIWAGMTDSRLEKPLLVIICCLALLLSALILLPGVRVVRERRAEREERAELEAVMAAEAERVQALPGTILTAAAGEEDLCLAVYDEAGEAIRDYVFSVSVTYPDGESFVFETDGEGLCYLYALPAGEYSAQLLPSEDYRGAGPVGCRVEGEDTAETFAAGQPLLEADGLPKYRYRALLGPNGRLLSRTEHRESNVMPIDSDGDGVPEYGLEFFPETAVTDEEGVVRRSGGYSRRVTLYGEDRLPVGDFAIYAEPVLGRSDTQTGWQFPDGKAVYLDANGRRVTGLRRIDGKLYYFDPEGVRARALGVDVSFYNEEIDWNKVKAQGIDFAVVRVGGRGWLSGVPYGDVRTHEYLLKAQAAGVKTGVYFYTTAIDEREAAEEARAALRTLNGIQLDLPIFIDMEYSGDYPYGRADRLNAAQRTAVIRAFCETVRAAGYKAGIYSGQYFYQHTLYYPAVAPYTVWLANYTASGQPPDFSGRYDIWQFSDRGNVDGIHGHVDMNVIF